MPLTKTTILRALKLAKGDRGKAATLLGCCRATLYRWLAANPDVSIPIAREGRQETRRHRIVVGSDAITVASLTAARRHVAERYAATIDRDGTVRNAQGEALGRTRALFPTDLGDGT